MGGNLRAIVGSSINAVIQMLGKPRPLGRGRIERGAKGSDFRTILETPSFRAVRMSIAKNGLCAKNPLNRPKIGELLNNGRFFEETYEPKILLNKLASAGIINSNQH
jgi:hypothetical protein